MDLVEIGGTFLQWALYLGLSLSVALLIVSVSLAAYGRWHPRLFFSALAGMLLAGSANVILEALTRGISLQDPYSALPPLVVGALIVGSVIYFALGKPELASKYFVAAALAAAFLAAAPYMAQAFGSGDVIPTGTCSLEVEPPTVDQLTVTLPVKMTYGKGSYTLTADWGDGQTSSASISPGGTAQLTHTYSEAGAYGITLKAVGEGVCYAVAGVNVNPSPLPWFANLINPLNVMQSVTPFINIPFHLLYTSPELDLSEGSDDLKIYSTVAALAMAFIGLAFVIRVSGGFFEKDPSESIVDSLKEAVLVVAVVVVAPYVYQIFVSMSNQVATLMLTTFQPNLAGVSALAAMIAASAVLGTVSDFFGTLGGVLVISMLFTSIIVTLRYALIKAIVLAAPLLAVAFLFPVARGAAKFFGSVLAGLILAGPVAALTFVALSNIPGLGGIVSFFAPVAALVVFPFVMSAASGGSPIAAASGLLRVGSGMFAGIAPRGGASAPGSSFGGAGFSAGGGAGGAGAGMGTGMGAGAGAGAGSPTYTLPAGIPATTFVGRAADGGRFIGGGKGGGFSPPPGFVLGPDGRYRYQFKTSRDYTRAARPAESETAIGAGTPPAWTGAGAGTVAGTVAVAGAGKEPEPAPITPPGPVAGFASHYTPSPVPAAESESEFEIPSFGPVAGAISHPPIQPVTAPAGESVELEPEISGHAQVAGWVSAGIPPPSEPEPEPGAEPVPEPEPTSATPGRLSRMISAVRARRERIVGFVEKVSPYLSYAYHVNVGQVHPKSFHDYRQDARERLRAQALYYQSRAGSFYYPFEKEEEF